MDEIVKYRLKNLSTKFQVDSLIIFEIVKKMVGQHKQNPTKLKKTKNCRKKIKVTKILLHVIQLCMNNHLLVLCSYLYSLF